jgi:hypothetical protein
MSYAVMPIEDYTAVCDSIREKTGKTEVIKSGEMPSAVGEVFDAGKQSEYEAFWDTYQKNGERKDYAQAFYGGCWTTSTLRPKYDIIPNNLTRAFCGNQLAVDLVEHFKSIGIVFDVSKPCHLQQCFESSKYTRVGELVCSEQSSMNAQIFNVCGNLVTIDRLTVCELNNLAMAFNGCTKLVNITMSGTIGNSLSFNWSPLSVESMKSIISCLKDYSETDKAYTYEIKFTNACWAALEADSTSPTGTTWAEYVDSLGWNI